MMPMKTILVRLFSRENLLALALCLIVLLLIVVTADAAPRWIYQGF
ncbi:MAG: hypothetical protein IT325_07440 [Anaerolineae bacterium]|nr:hypothetical protein [Anaerolineae bacterium]